MMVKPLRRRGRCEVQGCHKTAVVGFGPKGIDYLLCKDHFQALKDEVMHIDFDKPTRKSLIEKDVVYIETPKDSVAPTVEVIAPAEEGVKPNFEEGGEGFFECKYCGKKFPKAEMTVSQFATHARKCKKEHGYV